MNALATIEQPIIGNIEAEAALLGGLMQANNLIDRVADIITDKDFAEPIHGRIYSVIHREHSLGRTANPVTLKPYFADDESMKELGGASYLGMLTGSGASVIGAMDFARQVAELAMRRRMMEGLREIILKGANFETSTSELAADVETMLAESTRATQDGVVELSGGQCIALAIEGINRREPGVLSGIAPIDAAIGPIYRKDLVIKAGRPGIGKTAEAISYSIGAARRGHGVLFVTLEMSAEQIGQRAACDICFDSSACQVPYEHVTSGRINEVEGRELARAQVLLDELPFQVIDGANLPVHRLATMVRRWKRRFAAKGQSLDLVVVDYLQKLRAHGLTNRYEVVTEISQTLKEIAKANDLGVMALAQLSRKVEEREDKRPHMADLRESGQLEQDADVVLFLYRAEYYLKLSEPPTYKEDEHAKWVAAMEAVAGEMEFICAKRRKGQATTAKGRFYGAFQAVRGCYQ